MVNCKLAARRLCKACLFVTVLLLISVPPAYAYLDPGTGSYIFQLLIAGIVGFAFLLKVFWGRIKRFLGRGISQSSNQMEGEEDE
jgi:hypothetical protein